MSAFAPELAPLRNALRRRRGPDGGVVCVPVGIGAVDAAVGTARAIARLAPRMLLFVGTAGSYGREPAIGGIAIARRVRLASTAVARGDGYLPEAVVVTASCHSTIRRRLRLTAGLDAMLADVATPLAITKTTRLARRLSDATGCAVENLEVFAVARAATAARIPFGAVFGISNRVGPLAHEEWRQHQGRAVAAASAVIEAFLETAAPAAPTAPNRSAHGRRQRAG